MMSVETGLATGIKNTPGKKTQVKQVAREVSEVLGKYSFSEYFTSNVTNKTTKINKISKQHLLHRQKPRMLTIYYQMNVT
jgi:hypothetical protein